MADKDLIDAIARGIVVFDGAMGTTLQRMQLAGDLTVKDFEGRQGCNEILSVTRPDVVSGVHRSYFEVGCDVVETNTFGGSRPKLEEFELGARIAEVNEQAARIARAEADRAQRGDGRRRYVAGSLGPSGFLPSSSDPDLGRVSPAELTEIFREQTVPLLRGGVDCIIAETAQDLLELRSQIFGARRAMQETGRSVPLPLSCQPNAGIPENREGVAVYPLQPGELAEYLARFVRDFRLAVVGGCCGTTPVHLKQVVEAIRGTGAARKPPKRVPMLSSGLKAVALHQEPRPLI